jgi:hypothetical protein
MKTYKMPLRSFSRPLFRKIKSSNEHNFLIVMRNLFIAILAGLPVWMLQAQETPSVLDGISQKLAASQQLFPAEKTYFKTDKEVYAPGEIIWFSGIIVDRTTSRLSGLNTEIVVSLYDASGNWVSGDKYPVRGGKMHGDILLSENLPLGRYFLASFTTYQDEPENVFIRPVIIQRFYKSDATVSFVNPEKVYQAGTQADIELKITGFNGIPADKFALNYEIRQKDKVLEEGKIRSTAGKATVRALLPAITGKDPVELIVTHPKKLWSKKLLLRTTSDQVNMKFYVEGGRLTGAIQQKTGFYATVWNSIPIDLEADITNPSGQIVSKVKSFFPGMGLFPQQIKQGEKFKLTITSEYGKGQSFELPVVSESDRVGLLISKADNEFLPVDLLVNGGPSQKLAITATQGYHLLWAANLEIKENARIKIPLGELSPGVVQLTVFNDQAAPLLYRLVLVPEKSQADLRISDVSTEGGKLKMTVSVSDENAKPIAAGVVLSVTDTMRMEKGGKTLKGQMVLNGELLNPADESMFTPDDGGRSSMMLDYLMICNEIKSFSWDRILALKESKPGQFPEISTGLSGKVTDRKGNPVPNAKIRVMNNRDMKLYTAMADEKGFFKYQEYQPVNVPDLSITATDKDGKGNYQVHTNPTLSDKVGMKIKFLNNLYSEKTVDPVALSGYLNSNTGQIFEQPTIKLTTAGQEKPRVESYKTLLASASNLLDVIKSMKPYNLINGQIVFHGMINSLNAQSGALIVIDGVKMGTMADLLSNVAPYDVDEIHISTDPMDIQKYTGLNNVGVIEITTKKGTMVSSAPEKSGPKEELYKDGLRIPRNFLTADALAGQKGGDLRTTLYWNPDLEIGPSGTTTFSIPLSEIKSGFVITAEGFTTSGKIIQARQGFSVR